MMEGGVGESLIVRNVWVQGLELYTCKDSVFYFEKGLAPFTYTVKL